MHITEVLPHLHHQLGPHSEVLLHPSGPQVQVAVLHPQRLRFLSNRKTETQRFAIHSDHKYHSTWWNICTSVNSLWRSPWSQKATSGTRWTPPRPRPGPRPRPLALPVGEESSRMRGWATRTRIHHCSRLQIYVIYGDKRVSLDTSVGFLFLCTPRVVRVVRLQTITKNQREIHNTRHVRLIRVHYSIIKIRNIETFIPFFFLHFKQIPSCFKSKIMIKLNFFFFFYYLNASIFVNGFWVPLSGERRWNASD